MKKRISYKRDPEYKHIYAIWSQMRARCYNKNHFAYKDYGGRGILVCNRWLEPDNRTQGFLNFFNDMGHRPSRFHSLDRVRNEGNYEPNNCRWATKREQVLNRRNCINLEYNGIIKNIVEWSEELDLPIDMLRYRVSQNWEINKIFNTPRYPNKNGKLG